MENLQEKCTPIEALDMESIKDLLGVRENKQYEKYLGFLSFVGCNKKSSLVYTKERILSKLQGWKEKLLSQWVRRFS